MHVDAALPPASGEAPLAPDPMLEHLATLADLRAHERRMPLAYFRSRLGAPPGWVEQPQAHLALGDTYAPETAFARAHGWPTSVLDGALHLHHLVDPDAVATAVLDLAARLPAARVRSAPGPAVTTRE